MPINRWSADYTCNDEFPFHLLGISETTENYSLGFKMNNNLDGYILHSQPPKICCKLVVWQFTLEILQLLLSELT